MTGLIGSRIAGGNTGYKRRESDFYPTPPEATVALLNFLKLPKGTTIWEPACGERHIAKVMEASGYRVIGTDILYGQDFLTMPLLECDWIITNPPFSNSEEFIRKCESHNKPYALLLKIQYWNAAKRRKLFEETKPSYILPLTWRPDFCFKQRGKGSPLMDVMWVVWDLSKSRYAQFFPLAKPKERES